MPTNYSTSQWPVTTAPIRQLPVTSIPSPTKLTDEMSSIVNKALPGFNSLSSSATGIVGNLMSGLPSAGATQRANAYFGAGSGMGNSDFVRNRGFDLYGKEAEASKQRGFDDFLKLLSGYSGTVMPTVAQQQRSGEFAQDLQQRQNESNLGVQKWNAEFNNSDAGSGKAGEGSRSSVWSSDNEGFYYDKNGRKMGYDPQLRINRKIGW